MWSFPGSYANRGSGTEQASSDVEKDAYFDRISGWGSAPAGVGFTCLGRGSSYVNQAPIKVFIFAFKNSSEIHLQFSYK
jgi:hypothetical protein